MVDINGEIKSVWFKNKEGGYFKTGPNFKPIKLELDLMTNIDIDLETLDGPVKYVEAGLDEKGEVIINEVPYEVKHTGKVCAHFILDSFAGGSHIETTVPHPDISIVSLELGASIINERA